MAYCIHFKHFILPQFNAFSSIWHGFYTKSLYFFTLVHCLWKHLQHSLLCIVDKFIMYAQWNAICIFHGSPVNPIISNVSIMVRPYSTTVACDCIHGMSWHVNNLCTVKPDMLYNTSFSYLLSDQYRVNERYSISDERVAEHVQLFYQRC